MRTVPSPPRSLLGRSPEARERVGEPVVSSSRFVRWVARESGQTDGQTDGWVVGYVCSGFGTWPKRTACKHTACPAVQMQLLSSHPAAAQVSVSPRERSQ